MMGYYFNRHGSIAWYCDLCGLFVSPATMQSLPMPGVCCPDGCKDEGDWLACPYNRIFFCPTDRGCGGQGVLGEP